MTVDERPAAFDRWRAAQAAKRGLKTQGGTWENISNKTQSGRVGVAGGNVENPSQAIKPSPLASGFSFPASADGFALVDAASLDGAAAPRAAAFHGSQSTLSGTLAVEDLASAHTREQVNEGTKPVFFTEIVDRGDRKRWMPIYSASQIGAAVARAAVKKVQEELEAPPAEKSKPRNKRNDAGELVPGPYRPRFHALVGRARQHVHCIDQNPETAPRGATFATKHETCETDFVGIRSCDLRCCPHCNMRKMAKEIEKADFWFNAENVGGRSVRFLTITIPNRETVEEGVAELLRDVKTFRRRPYFKARTRAGVFAIEWTKYGDTWHVHAHMVLVGRYMSQEKLAEMWAEIRGITPGKSIGIDIRQRNTKPIDSFKECLGYVYSTKQRLYPKLDDYAEVEISLRGRRLITKFGEFHRLAMPRTPKACAACEVTDGHWRHRGMPSECDHAAFIAATRAAENDHRRPDGLFAINRGRKVAEVSPRIKHANAAYERTTRAGETNATRRRRNPRHIPGPTPDELEGT